MMILRFASAGRLFLFVNAIKRPEWPFSLTASLAILRGLGSSLTSNFPQTAGVGKYRTQRPWLPCALLANLFTMAYIPWLYVAEKLRFLYNCIQT